MIYIIKCLALQYYQILTKYINDAPNQTAFDLSFTVPSDNASTSVNGSSQKKLINSVSYIAFNSKFTSNDSTAISQELASIQQIITNLTTYGYPYTSSTSGSTVSDEFSFTLPTSSASQFLALYG